MTKQRIKEIEKLVDAILRDIKWRQHGMQLKQDRKIKQMLLRNRTIRQDSKFGLSD